MPLLPGTPGQTHFAKGIGKEDRRIRSAAEPHRQR